MLSYRHIYHAGNFADVFKHALLTRLLIALNAKEKPYCYLDTHAGIGRYDLKHPWAQQAREYESGIARLWSAKNIPPALHPYLDVVRAENPDGKLRYYPGSPLIAQHFVRATDRITLIELNKVDFAELQAVFAGQRRVAVQLMDAYHGLKAYVPPAERRGLVLIDSSFDRARELDRIVKALKDAYARWATGMYAVWYPILEHSPMRDFFQHVERSGIRKVLRLEIVVRADDESGLIPGCGMLVVNPPWHFDREAKSLLQWLAPVLAIKGTGEWRVDWLVPE
jgi:23S rRNA (adenine2030-N6)-methyltransferase